MVRYYSQYHSENKIFWISLKVNSSDSALRASSFALRATTGQDDGTRRMGSILPCCLPFGKSFLRFKPPALGSSKSVQFPAGGKFAESDVAAGGIDEIAENRNHRTAFVPDQALHLHVHLASLVFIQFSSGSLQQQVETFIIPESLVPRSTA